MKLSVGSLFSGIGGIEYGLERTGHFQTIWHSEIDPWASAVLAKHWPAVENLGDITKINWNKVQRPDLIVGGFPCQDISQAGRQAGLRQGKRSGLWSEYAKAIRILRPRYVLIENVPALAYLGLDVVLADLASCGYDAEWQVVSAADVGAPHLRERIFIVAYPNVLRRDGEPANREGGEPQEYARPEAGQRGQDLADSQGQQPHGGGKAGDRGAEPTDGGPIPYGPDNWAGRGLEQPQEGQAGGNVANTNRKGVEGRPEARIFGSEGTNLLEHIRRRNKGDWGCWESDAAVLRVAHGIPNRVHRIKCVGNAVVPQVAEVIGQMIAKDAQLLKIV